MQFGDYVQLLNLGLHQPNSKLKSDIFTPMLSI